MSVSFGKLGCVTNFGMLLLVFGFIYLIFDEIKFVCI